jgi:hypothetical protein
MNSQERAALEDFLKELMQARATRKDREAESMIYQAVAYQPDAAYLLVQRTLLQEQALDAAKREIAALRSQIEQAMSSGNTSFLESPSHWANGNRYYNVPSSRHPDSVGAAYRYASPSSYYPPSSRPGLLNGGMGSFLGSMAATAAGVAAGSFLFHGIGGLLHDHEHSGSSGLADFNHDNGSQFMDDSGADYGGLAGDAGIDDIGEMDDFS